MRTGKAGRVALALVVGIVFTSCRKPEPKVDWSTRDEIPPSQLDSVIDAHYRGLGAMERYEYARASEAFREVHEKAPGWITGSINLAIALLNQGGEAEVKAKSQGQSELAGEPRKNIDDAVGLLEGVLARQPDNLWAHFCRGIIYEHQGMIQEAYLDFKKVTEVDPLDANAWLERGSTLTEPDGSRSGPARSCSPN